MTPFSNVSMMDNPQAPKVLPSTMTMTRDQALRAAEHRSDVQVMEWVYDEHEAWEPSRAQAAIQRIVNFTLGLSSDELQCAIDATPELAAFRSAHPKIVEMLSRRDFVTNPAHMQIVSHIMSAHALQQTGAISEEQAKGAVAKYAAENLKQQADNK
jgi:hypothetical protein